MSVEIVEEHFDELSRRRYPDIARALKLPLDRVMESVEEIMGLEPKPGRPFAPVETRYVLQRFFSDPWRMLALTSFFLGWVIPFSYFLGRLTGRPPEGHRILIVISSMALLAVFLEVLVLVLPSTVSGYGAGNVLLTLMMTAGFGALFALSFRVFVSRLGLTSRGEA